MTECPALRIAHFIDTQNKGGAEVTLMDLCIYQKQAGYDVIVFHHNNEFITKSCGQHQIKQADIPSYRFYKSTYTLPLYAISFAKRLIQLKVDVLHSHLFGPITGNAMATRLSGCQHIGTLHDIYMIEEKPSRAKLLQLASMLKTKLVCVSNNMADFYIKHMKSTPEKILTIYNAARIPEFPSAETQNKLITHYQIAEDDLIITAVGRLVPLKRVDRIIQALSAINQNNVKLFIIGDGPEASSLRSLVTSLNLDSQVIFTGEISNVSDLLYLSHIFAQFSSTEGLSVSIIEAMACKLPCVVSDVGGNAELVVEGKTGYVIDSERDDLLINRLSKLLEDKKQRSQFGTHAFSHFNNHFTFEKFQHAYLDLYRANN